MLKDLNREQLALAKYMSALSEEAYCAGWMEGLEVALWQAVLGHRVAYGRVEFDDASLAKLRFLAERCGGWIAFDDDREEIWLSLTDWERRFSAISRLDWGELCAEFQPDGSLRDIYVRDTSI